MRIGPLGVASFRHFVVRQTVLQRAFTNFSKIRNARKHDVEGTAGKLVGTSSHAIKFLDRQLESTVILRAAAQKRCESPDFKNGLNRSLTKCVLIPDNDCAAEVLKRRRKN